jgi:hypothetical protein
MNIGATIDRIYQSGSITRADENQLFLAMVAEQPLSGDQQSQVRDLFARLQMGLLRVLD